MLKYTLSRVLAFIPTCFLGATAVFLALRLLPGDPAIALLGPTATQEAIEEFRRSVHLDLPIWEQYLRFIEDLVTLNLGHSIVYDRPAGEIILAALPYTVDLTILATIISVTAGIPLGIMSAYHSQTLIDKVTRIVSLVGASSPIFYTGMVLILLFSVMIPIFPIFGGGDLSDLSDRVFHLVLPAVSLGFFNLAIVVRTTRASMLDVLNMPFVTTARAKGIPERVVLLKHTLKNALIPIITVVGVNLNITIGGAILTETVFARPGIGTVIIRAVESRDYEVIQAGLIVILFIVLLVNLLIDLTYSFVDPRVRLK